MECCSLKSRQAEPNCINTQLVSTVVLELKIDVYNLELTHRKGIQIQAGNHEEEGGGKQGLGSPCKQL